MGGQNLYLRYKKDTSRLLYWVINTSNGIVRSAASPEDHAPVTLNTTGQSTVVEIVQMSELIARYLQPVPSAILSLFQAVIKARSATHAAFQQIVNQKPDPEIEKSNATHKHFIDALSRAFYALGGDSQALNSNATVEDEDYSVEVDNLVFKNQYSILSIRGDGEEEEDGAASEDGTNPTPDVQKKKPNKKGTKGKQARKSKKKQSQKQTSEPTMADVPIESYRIIEDKGGLVSDYLLAVYAVSREWISLRASIQGLWQEVAYDGLNGAVAASMSNVAVAMVRQTCNAIFVDFPGHESYDTIMKTLTRGNPDTAQGNFGVQAYRVSGCGHQSEMVKDTRVDIKEQLWINTYNDLMDFLNDFRQNRTGKPTKAMQKQIGNWNPTLDLQRLTNEERLTWRRAYTINWLYDLVNVFSSVVVQRNTVKGEKHVYEDVDWSKTGPWHVHRTLFGLNEFAGVIAGFAWQKPHTSIRQKILPHHIFQLQCIVDSLSASRGWTVNLLHGHMLQQPARNFRPRRDVDMFLDRKNERIGQGFPQAVHILKQVFEKDAQEHRQPNMYKEHSDLLEEFSIDFTSWLGESKYMYGLNTIPPSRFSSTNANGLWEYSPLLCAAGLVEGLVLTHRICMYMWDRMTEPTLAIHLHNMLVQKGYIKEPIGLYSTLEELFKESFFPNGVPESNFFDALVKRVQVRNDSKALRQRKAMASQLSHSNDYHDLLNVSANYFFKKKSALTMYYDADWISERIPESDIPFPTFLSVVRLRETKKVTNPATGSTVLDSTELVERAKTFGLDDKALIEMVSEMPKEIDRTASMEEMLRNMNVRKGYRMAPDLDPYNLQKPGEKSMTGSELLDCLRCDIFADVCGSHPLSSLNYVWITVTFMMLFMRIEDRLRDSRHPLYVQSDEEAPAHMRRQQRTSIIMAAMGEENHEALKIFAEVFQDPRTGVMGHIFWKNLREEEDGTKPERESDVFPTDNCSVM